MNGVVCCSWKTEDSPFASILNHISSSNLVKVSILNGSVSFRQYAIGFCDKVGQVKQFHMIQSDCGYTYPERYYISTLSPAERRSYFIDLQDYKDGEAIMFFYDIDLTNLNQFKSNPLDLCHSPPSGILKKPILSIVQSTDTCKPKETVLDSVEKIVFGENKQRQDYFFSLNRNFFYNLPQLQANIQSRNFVLFEEVMQTAMDNQATEFCMGAQRIYVDMWNRDQVSGKPSYPSCLFSISKYKNGILKYINYQIHDNHLLNVVVVDPVTNETIKKLSIVFPEITAPLHINEWVHLVNRLYYKILLKNEDSLNLNWSHHVLPNCKP